MHWGSSWSQKLHGICFLWHGHGQGLQSLGLVLYLSPLYVIFLIYTCFQVSLVFLFPYKLNIQASNFFYWFISFPSFLKFFVIGHDCAHKSFSRNKLLEDIVGTLAFLPLIYPYEPWRFKHDRHHAKTNMFVWYFMQFIYSIELTVFY